MSIEHLSDEQIQNLAENNSINNTAQINEHLSACAKCQTALDNYKILFTSIANTEQVSLSVDFNSQVLSRIKTEAVVSEQGRYETIIYILSGIAASFAALIYVMGQEDILGRIKSFSLTQLIPDFSFMTAITDLFARYDSITTILIFAGLTLVFFALLDKYLAKIKIGKTSLMSI